MERSSNLSIVRDWLCAWSGNVRDAVHREPTPNMRLVSLAKDSLYGAGGQSFVFIRGQRAASSPELMAAFAAASTGHNLPLEWRLFEEAVVHAHREQYRHAVIAASSAAEVALSKAAKEALVRSGCRRREAADIVGGVTGVAELYRLNARDGLAPTLQKVMSELARPRNPAVHAGDSLDGDSTRKAITTARALLEVSPLPKPRDLSRHLKDTRP
jgi:hypothetical protein